MPAQAMKPGDQIAKMLESATSPDPKTADEFVRILRRIMAPPDTIAVAERVAERLRVTADTFEREHTKTATAVEQSLSAVERAFKRLNRK